MSDGPRPSFDPHRFVELARRVGHGKALGLEYRASGPNWMELSLPWREELVGVPETGVLASGAIVSLIDTACARVAMSQNAIPAPIDDCQRRLSLIDTELKKHLSANRTQGVPNMIALIRETAQRLAA